MDLPVSTQLFFAIENNNVSEARRLILLPWTDDDYLKLSGLANLIKTGEMASVLLPFLRNSQSKSPMLQYSIRSVEKKANPSVSLSYADQFGRRHPTSFSIESIGRLFNEILQKESLLPTLNQLQEKYYMNRSLVKDILSQVVIDDEEYERRMRYCYSEECCFHMEETTVSLTQIPIDDLRQMIAKGYLPDKHVPMISAVLSDTPINVTEKQKDDYKRLVLKADAINSYLQLGSQGYRSISIYYAGERILSNMANDRDYMEKYMYGSSFSEDDSRILNEIIKRTNDPYIRNMALAKAARLYYFYLLEGRINSSNVVPILSQLKHFDRRLASILSRAGINPKWFEYLLHPDAEIPSDLPPDLWRKVLPNAIVFDNKKLVERLISLYRNSITPEMKEKMLSLPMKESFRPFLATQLNT